LAAVARRSISAIWLSRVVMLMHTVFSGVITSTRKATTPFTIFGPYQDPSSHYSGVLAKFTMQMLAGEQPTIFGDGEQSRDFTFIQNVVRGNLLAAQAPADKVAGGVWLRPREVGRAAGGATGIFLKPP
jgi:nucleoside-diphosphate-sugar epimerase